MRRKVVISKTAELKLEKLFDYLLQEWSLKVKSEFVKKLDKTIEIIKEQPRTFPESQNFSGLRKCVITKHITLYYKFDENAIQILTYFDSRQNPENLEEDLNKQKY